MNDKKHTGSYYTPKILSDFLAEHVAKNYVNKGDLSVLEPSCGDGQFVSSLLNSLNLIKENDYSINLFDINKSELNRARSLIPPNSSIRAKAYNQDYLQHFLDNDSKYSLIIGNPPYINKKNMQAEQIDVCEEVHKKTKEFSCEVKSSATIKNIWPAFVEASIMSLDSRGVLCLVIPAEILQVKYTSELRSLITSEFDVVEIFAFNELIFDGVQQDVVALVGAKGVKNTNKHGFSFYQVDALDDLKEPKFTEKHCNIHRTTLDKWTNYILSDAELNFIEDLKNSYWSIKHYCKKAEVGIVSAANDFFILTDDNLKDNDLNRLKSIVKPILPKGYVVPDVAKFTSNDFHDLKKNNRKVNFLRFPDIPKNKLGKIASAYLKLGEKIKLHKRYKMLRRTHWYHIPSVWVSEGLFVKRCHLFPKMFVNETEALATDSFYRVETSESYSIQDLVFSFYNSLTFVLAELEGRYYGGGVLELTPNEFKNLAIPYLDKVTNKELSTLDKMLRDSKDIEEILLYTNSILFDDVDISRLEAIRKKLVNRRLKRDEIKECSTKIIKLKHNHESNDNAAQIFNKDNSIHTDHGIMIR